MTRRTTRLTMFMLAAVAAMLLWGAAFSASAFAAPGDSEPNATYLNDYLGSSITTGFAGWSVNPDGPTTYFYKVLLNAGDTLQADFTSAPDVINLVAIVYYGTYPGSVALSPTVQRLTYTAPITNMYTIYVAASTPGTFTTTPVLLPSAPQTVWRFRNLQTGFYLWSADPSEKQTIINTLSRTWFYEGPSYTINTANPLNHSPLWRFRNLRTGTYLWSADPAEKATIINTLSGTWLYEGPSYNVSVDPSGAPVWRFRNLRTGTYLWSADPGEKQTIINTLSGTWFYEGPSYYLAP